MNDFSITRSLVERYADDCEAWKADHQAAMDCCDCDEALARGLQVFQWIEELDAQLREADSLGIVDYSREAYDAVTELYRLWLLPCDLADAWISKIDGGGYTLDNLAEFKEACEQARATVEDREWLANSEDTSRASMLD